MKTNLLEALKHQRVLVAISGGIDSVVLAHLLYSHGAEVILAHCNFSLRGEESDDDEAFVRSFAERLGVQLLVVRFDTHAYAKEHQLNTQLAARELRYEWFDRMAQTYDCAYIATAHHANDNLETFLINLSRGSGLDGLLGIPEQNGKLIRPLLSFSRQQIYQYAQAKQLSWREDSSNASNKYVRNVIRHEIIPQMRYVHPNYLENFNQTQEYLHQSARFIDYYIEKIRSECFQGEPIRISTSPLLQVPELPLVLHRLFYPYGFNNVKDLQQLLFTAEAGKQLCSPSHQLIKDKEWVWLLPIEGEEESPFLIAEGTREVSTPIRLLFEEVQPTAAISEDPNTISVDADKLEFPLALRHKHEGDVFYPIGLGSAKKLSKYFIDEKYSQIARQQQWLLCSGDRIVWVVGKRLDHRFRVTPKTKRVLQISVVGNSQIC